LNPVRRLAAITLAVLLALPAGDLRSAPANGTISGVVRLDGRPLAGVTVAFVELQSGDVVRATSRENGTFEVQAPPGEYAVTTESVAGLTVDKAPVRVAVASGSAATAEIDLVAVPSAVGPDIAAPGAGAAATPPAEGQPPATPPTTAPGGPVYAETTGQGAQIQFEPVTCFVAGEFPLLDASIEPIATVARARVYFKAAGGDAFFYVEMSQDRGRYFGKLPRPRVEASPIRYYLQSTTTEFEESQTREIEALVVKDRAECGDRKIAAYGPSGPVTVFSASTGAIASPIGFAALAASSIAVGVVTLIAVGAATAGIVGGVVVGPGAGPTPPGQIVPSPIPIPTPITIPTPVPLPTLPPTTPSKVP
jgi:hypothetical protein